MHYTCIACITIDSVMRIEKKNYPQVYLEECKYRIKKIQMSRFINAELKSESESESESESDSHHFERVKKINSHFADFEQVKKTIVNQSLNKSKIKDNKTLFGETGCLCIFCFECSGIVLYFTSLFLTQPVRIPLAILVYLPLTAQHLCDLQDTMPCHWSPGTSHPTSYLGRQRISLRVTIILSICLCSHTSAAINQKIKIITPSKYAFQNMKVL